MENRLEILEQRLGEVKAWCFQRLVVREVPSATNSFWQALIGRDSKRRRAQEMRSVLRTAGLISPQLLEAPSHQARPGSGSATPEEWQEYARAKSERPEIGSLTLDKWRVYFKEGGAFGGLSIENWKASSTWYLAERTSWWAWAVLVAWERQEIVDRLCLKRSKLLDPGMLRGTARGLGGGRLICTDPYPPWGGAAESASHEFFDEEDLPPWDTWIAYLPERNIAQPASLEDAANVHFYLVSWVPPEFVDLVQAGIEASSFGSIQWATDLDIEDLRALKARGSFG